MKTLLRTLVLLACGALAAAVATAVLQLPERPPLRLAGAVAEKLADSGVTHPVTAVLLNFRAYDTLLEIAVLLLALLGVQTVVGEGQANRRRVAAAPQPVLQALARIVAPLMVLVAGYLLWAGASRPGGAFQAGAVLASCVVLLHLAGLMPAPAAAGRLLCAGLTCGFALFLAVAALGLAYGSLLRYPPALAGALILLIESSLTLSLGLLLAALFLWLPDENQEPRQ